ncbi:hypothetical protein RFI_33228 [Reticulomyxa filosa]|uniref:Macro domain-containing protein n=1 Tax=Reticulomyxa filosa TaxID=46433 RepID=X6LTW3_RETFI|nr:hypothetical protein RFI_33228 [Reticulomyxa filosa]|eukprot:ETO04170.1 hypothetical protein RFI_33228 [Reticulomyxa filosa]
MGHDQMEGSQLNYPYDDNDNDNDNDMNETDMDEHMTMNTWDMASEDGDEVTRGTTTQGGYPFDNALRRACRMPWHNEEELTQELDLSYGHRDAPRFPIQSRLNHIIRMWDGMPLLECDALVVPISEKWTPVSQVSHFLMSAAGSTYLSDIYEMRSRGEYIGTGEVQRLHPYNLPCQHLIHCVPPFYDDKRPVASENALQSCYWRSLELASDLQCRSIVIPPLYPDRLYSEELAVHMMSRTLRRFLERCPESFMSVVIVTLNESQMMTYTTIMTMYFPRDTIDEKFAMKYVPYYTGDESGSTVVKARKCTLAQWVNPLQNLLHKLHASSDGIQIRTVESGDGYAEEEALHELGEPGVQLFV